MTVQIQTVVNTLRHCRHTRQCGSAGRFTPLPERLTCPLVLASASVSVHRPTCPCQRPPGPGLLHPVSGQLSTRHPVEVPVVRRAVSCCLSAAGIRFLDTLSRRDFRPHCCRPTASGLLSQSRDGPMTRGFHVARA